MKKCFIQSNNFRTEFILTLWEDKTKFFKCEMTWCFCQAQKFFDLINFEMKKAS